MHVLADVRFVQHGGLPLREPSLYTGTAHTAQPQQYAHQLAAEGADLRQVPHSGGWKSACSPHRLESGALNKSYGGNPVRGRALRAWSWEQFDQ